MVSKFDINPQTGKQYGINPQSGVQDDNFWATQVEPKLIQQDPVALAQRQIKLQQEANQPAINTLQGQVDPLKQRYSNLLTSIKGQQKVAEDSQTLATNNELGKRGISADSGIAQQEQASAQRPIAQQYQGLSAQTGLNQEHDLGGIAQAIAQLQSGAAQTGISQGLNLFQGYQQADQAAQQLALQREQANMKSAPDPYMKLGEGDTIYDLANKKALFTSPKTYKTGLQDQFSGNDYYNTSTSNGPRYSIVK